MLLSSDSIAVKLLNTVDSINNLVQMYLKLFSQTKILTMVLFVYFFNAWISDLGCFSSSGGWCLFSTKSFVIFACHLSVCW